MNELANGLLLATDFSQRSDRATRRAELLATQMGKALTLLHVVDDDQPQELKQLALKEARTILARMAGTMRDVDGLDCQYRVTEGDAHAGILSVARALEPFALILGSHRHRLLKDVLVGTTLERTIRASDFPVLKVSALPTGFYKHVLVACDFSEGTRQAIRLCKALQFDGAVRTSVIHVFEAPAGGILERSSVAQKGLAEYEQDIYRDKEMALRDFVQKEGLSVNRLLLRPNHRSPATEILDAAKKEEVDLIIAGIHGRSGLEKILLGSVMARLLEDSEIDVMAASNRLGATSGQQEE